MRAYFKLWLAIVCVAGISAGARWLGYPGVAVFFAGYAAMVTLAECVLLGHGFISTDTGQ